MGPRIPLNPPLQGSLSKDQSQLMTMPLQQPQFPMVPPGAMLLPGGTTPVPAPIPMSVGAGQVPPDDAPLSGSAMMVPVSVPLQDEKVSTPWGWKRVLLGEAIVFFSPSGIQLKSKEEI